MKEVAVGDPSEISLVGTGLGRCAIRKFDAVPASEFQPVKFGVAINEGQVESTAMPFCGQMAPTQGIRPESESAFVNTVCVDVDEGERVGRWRLCPVRGLSPDSPGWVSRRWAVGPTGVEVAHEAVASQSQTSRSEIGGTTIRRTMID